MSHDDLAEEQPRKKIKVEHDPTEALSKANADLVREQSEQERKCGITVFASEGQTFSCVVKQR